LDDDSFPSTAPRPAPPPESVSVPGSATSIIVLAALPKRCSDLLLDADGAGPDRRRGLARTSGPGR
jgi:hypothetical protein